MQSRLLKTIPATCITGRETVSADTVLSEDERAALNAVARQFAPVIKLRHSGLTSDEIRRLEFVRWTIRGRKR